MSCRPLFCAPTPLGVPGAGSSRGQEATRRSCEQGRVVHLLPRLMVHLQAPQGKGGSKGATGHAGDKEGQGGAGPGKAGAERVSTSRRRRGGAVHGKALGASDATGRRVAPSRRVRRRRGAPEFKSQSQNGTRPPSTQAGGGGGHTSHEAKPTAGPNRAQSTHRTPASLRREEETTKTTPRLANRDQTQKDPPSPKP